MTAKRNSAIVTMTAAALITVGASAQTASDIEARLVRLERILDGRGLVELLERVDALQNQVQQLQGQLDNQTYTIDQLRKQQRDLYVNLDQRLQSVETGVAAPPGSVVIGNEPPLTTLDPATAPIVAGTPAMDNPLSVEVANGGNDGTNALPRATDAAPTMARPGISTASDTSAVSATSTGTQYAAMTPIPRNALSGVDVVTVDSPESEAAYREAFSLLKAGQYEQAVDSFRTFREQYPASQYMDNAQYWIGESYYVLRQFEPAIAEYQRLLQLFPDSQKYSHAMLKIGYSYYELGQTDLARATLEDLKLNFPTTTAAKLADERIQRIRLEAAR